MNISENFSLRKFNTFGIDVRARYFLEFHSSDELIQIHAEEKFKNVPLLIIGGGSNLLFIQDFNGLVLRNRISGIEVLKEDSDFVFIRSGAGVVWHDLVTHCTQNNLGGIENLSLIPGSVGAAPMQNIGAYGVELKEVFDSLEAFEISSGKIVRFTKEQCKFGYRESVFKNVFKNAFIILNVTLRLSKNHMLNTSYGAIGEELKKMGVDHPTIKNVSEAVCNIRRSKLPDPSVTGNAGSFFKNPEIAEKFYLELKEKFPALVAYPAERGKMKLAAGWMIERCGWKGKVFGNAGVHEKQALVLINMGNAAGQEIFNLSVQIKNSVFEKFGVQLETEVNII